jgi:hypothetical protein
MMNERVYVKGSAITPSSYVIFGSSSINFTNIDLRSSDGVEQEMNWQQVENRVYKDYISRSTTNVGDINNDGYNDLVVGYPELSRCLVYLGMGNGFTDLPLSFAFYGEVEGDGFGWAVSAAKDMNEDGIDDLLISAKNEGMIYLIYGKVKFKSDVFVGEMTPDEGVKIIGLRTSSNTGMSISSAGDFNNDGHNDLLISNFMQSAQTYVYVLYGKGNETSAVIDLNNFNQQMGFKIISPFFSFAGLSLTGLGDINGDDCDDIIIGSVPYEGGYLNQRSYVVFGRKFNSGALALGNMEIGVDGFIINGGGFLVGGPGDVNNDGIADVFVVRHMGWQGQGNAYVVVLPTNVSLVTIPSSQPTGTPTVFHFPTNQPTLKAEKGRTRKPVGYRSPQPTSLPSISMSPSFEPTRKPINPTAVPTVLKSNQPICKPSLSPSVSPSRTRPRSFVPTTEPFTPFAPTTDDVTLNPSVLAPSVTTAPVASPNKVTSNTNTRNFTNYQLITISKEGTYRPPNNYTNELFFISLGGTIIINNLDPKIQNKPSPTAAPSPLPEMKTMSNAVTRVTTETKYERIYKIISLSSPANSNPKHNQKDSSVVIINYFDPKNDVIDLALYSSFANIYDIPYYTNPLTLVLSNDEKQKVKIKGIKNMNELSNRNFIFQSSYPADTFGTGKHSSGSQVKDIISAVIGPVGIVILVIVLRIYFPELFQREDAMDEYENDKLEMKYKGYKMNDEPEQPDEISLRASVQHGLVEEELVSSSSAVVSVKASPAPSSSDSDNEDSDEMQAKIFENAKDNFEYASSSSSAASPLVRMELSSFSSDNDDENEEKQVEPKSVQIPQRRRSSTAVSWSLSADSSTRTPVPELLTENVQRISQSFRSAFSLSRPSSMASTLSFMRSGVVSGHSSSQISSSEHASSQESLIEIGRELLQQPDENLLKTDHPIGESIPPLHNSQSDTSLNDLEWGNFNQDEDNNSGSDDLEWGKLIKSVSRKWSRRRSTISTMFLSKEK